MVKAPDARLLAYTVYLYSIYGVLQHQHDVSFMARIEDELTHVM